MTSASVYQRPSGVSIGVTAIVNGSAALRRKRTGRIAQLGSTRTRQLNLRQVLGS